MQSTLTKPQTSTKTIRQFIEWLSFSGRELFVHEFHEFGNEFFIHENYIMITCSDGICRLTLHNQFANALTLTVFKQDA